MCFHASASLAIIPNIKTKFHEVTKSMNEERLNQLLGRFLDDFGAVFHGAMVVIGDKLGLYKTLAASGPLTPKELAERTGTAPRYVSEWLCSQAAGGYVTYDGASGRYSLTEEQAFTMA